MLRLPGVAKRRATEQARVDLLAMKCLRRLSHMLFTLLMLAPVPPCAAAPGTAGFSQSAPTVAVFDFAAATAKTALPNARILPRGA